MALAQHARETFYFKHDRSQGGRYKKHHGERRFYFVPFPIHPVPWHAYRTTCKITTGKVPRRGGLRLFLEK